MSVITETYSDWEMQCPPAWQNGYKRAWVKNFGQCERALSNASTGAWSGSSTTVEFLDPQRLFRQQLASTVDRYWIEPWEILMTTRENRAALGVPWTVFVGLVSKITPKTPLGLDVQLADLVGQRIITDDSKIPWRRVLDGPLDEFTQFSSDYNHDQPEPILYGTMDKLYGGYAPAYIGRVPLVVGGVATSYHAWLVAGHAIKAIPQWYVNGVAQVQGADVWLVPTYSNWTTVFTTPYRDQLSRTYVVTRRYVWIYGKVGSAAPDAAATAGTGQEGLTINFQGAETVGDGSGTTIISRIEQYNHFVTNYVANYGEASYHTGAWLTSPNYTLIDETVPMVDDTSFDACFAIAILRTPPLGYIGCAVIGATAGDRRGARDWIGEWNRSCGVRFGVTRKGQFIITMLHPTTADKAAAEIYTDAYEIVKGGFGTDLQWDDQANVLIFAASYNWTTGSYESPGICQDFDSIALYDKRLVGPQLQYLFVPNFVGGQHLGNVEVVRVSNPPKAIQITQGIPNLPIGASPVPTPLAKKELGDYIQYVHYAAVGAPGQVRLAQIEKMVISPSARTVRVEAIDCEDLIGYDMFDAAVSALAGPALSTSSAVDTPEWPDAGPDEGP